MRPTVDEQLAGVDRLLEQIGADPGGAPGEALLLRDARRQLGRLRGSLDQRLPFLRWDNAASLAVLQAIAPQLPDELAARIGPLAAAVDEGHRDERQVAERNDAIRTLLGDALDALDALPEAERIGDANRAAHRRIVDHLRARASANPALHKNPTIPEPPHGRPVTDPSHPETGPEDPGPHIPDLRPSDEHFTEQFPLSPLDDYMIHQTPDPIRIMWSGDPRTYERYWMLCHDPSGETLVAVGGSFYPNLDRAEAYAIVNHSGRHTTVRGFRRLGVDRTDMGIGPIQPKIVRGMRWWRFELEPNEWGISFRLDFTDTTRQTFREPLSNSATGVPPGRRGDVTTGFESFGAVEGWVDVDGTRIDFPPGCFGTRDRHWGVGRGVGGPPMSLGGRLHVGTSGNGFAAFPSWTLWGDRVFYPFGDERKGSGRVDKPSRRLRFEPETNIFVEGIVDYPLDTGEVKQVHYERIGNQTAYLRCGMYGGTPDKDIHQGGYEGPDLVEGETYDVNDPDVRARLAGLDEHLCRVTCNGEQATGFYQPIDPSAYEACAAGRPGWSFLTADDTEG